MSNKVTKLAVLSLLGILGITACGEAPTAVDIYAKKDDYDNPVITYDNDDTPIHNNILSKIYDAIHEGSLPSTVLEDAMYKYAESIFGVYNTVTKADRDVKTLKDAVDEMIANRASINDDDFPITNEFIKAHKAYWNYNDLGQHVGQDGTTVVDDKTFTPCAIERDNVLGKYNAIETRIAEAMYSKALNGSFTTKNLFDEEKFIKSLSEAGEKVDMVKAKTYVNETVLTNPIIRPILVPYTVEKDQVFGQIQIIPPLPAESYYINILHRELYQSSVANDNTTATYIEDKVIPTIYSDLLIEQYLVEEDSQAIRNSKARRINVIKIEKYGNYTINAQKLVEHLVDDIYSVTPATADKLNTKTYKAAADVEDTSIEGIYRTLFERYGKISKGLYDEFKTDTAATKIVDDINKEASDAYKQSEYTYGGKTYTYYENTQYGDLVKEFKKLTTSTTYTDLDKDLYNSYTSNGQTTMIEGMEQKTIAIAQTENITKGWFIGSKNPSLDSGGVINKSLFTLSVADRKVEVKDDANVGDPAYDKLAATDRWVKTKNGEWKLRIDTTAADVEEGESYGKWANEYKYLCSINGAYFLKFQNQYSGSDKRSDIVLDDGNAYYIVQVLEAAKDSKLRNKSQSPTNSYATTRSSSLLHEITDEICKNLGQTGNYSSVSKNYWLKKMSISYHDTEVFNYFLNNYPDIFK